MEYSINDLPKAVYYVLSLNRNKMFTMSQLYSEILSSDCCPDFSKTSFFSRSMENTLSNACLEAMKTWKNIVFDGKYCSLQMEDSYDIEEIRKMVKEPLLYDDFSLDRPYYGGQTILHILCKEGDSDLLDELSRTFQINVMTKNDKGQSLLDVIPVDKQETMRTLFRITLNQMRDIQNLAISEIKSKNTDLLKKNDSLIKSNDRLHYDLLVLKNKNRSLENKIYALYFLMFLVSAIVSVVNAYMSQY